METIVAAIITGIFSLLLVRYQNQLSKRQEERMPPPVPQTQAVPQAPAETSSRKISPLSKYRIVLSFLIIALPWALGALLGKDVFGGDENMSAYFFIWTLVTVVATIIGWSKKKLFEKLLLIVSAGLLLWLAISYVIEMNRRHHATYDQIRPADTQELPTDTAQMQRNP